MGFLARQSNKTTLIKKQLKENGENPIISQYIECVRLTKCHQYVFSVSSLVSLKFGACYITGQCGEFRVKNATIGLHVLFSHFFVVFHHKICVFIIFLFMIKSQKFRSRILTNQKLELVVSNCQRNCMRSETSKSQ